MKKKKKKMNLKLHSEHIYTFQKMRQNKTYQWPLFTLLYSIRYHQVYSEHVQSLASVYQLYYIHQHMCLDLRTSTLNEYMFLFYFYTQQKHRMNIFFIFWNIYKINRDHILLWSFGDMGLIAYRSYSWTFVFFLKDNFQDWIFCFINIWNIFTLQQIYLLNIYSEMKFIKKFYRLRK